MVMEILLQFKDKNGRKFDEKNFLIDEEIQPPMIKLQKIINQRYSKWYLKRGQRNKLIKETGWTAKQIQNIIILKELIFGDKSYEAKIIWSEVNEHIIRHIMGLIHDKKNWVVRNRFWTNSKYVQPSLGSKYTAEITTKIGK